MALGGPHGRCAAVPLVNFGIGLFLLERETIKFIRSCKGHNLRVSALSFTSSTSVLASGGMFLHMFLRVSGVMDLHCHPEWRLTTIGS